MHTLWHTQADVQYSLSCEAALQISTCIILHSTLHGAQTHCIILHSTLHGAQTHCIILHSTLHGAQTHCINNSGIVRSIRPFPLFRRAIWFVHIWCVQYLNWIKGWDIEHLERYTYIQYLHPKCNLKGVTPGVILSGYVFCLFSTFPLGAKYTHKHSIYSHVYVERPVGPQRDIIDYPTI
jgi:hypothetical protein